MAVAGTLTYKTELDTSGIQKSGSTVKSIIAGLGITKLISTAMNTIKNSTDDAIKRLDTLNNFPKVMSNLGISAKESQKSIEKMSDKLAGLPTTLDQGASAVQRFTSANGDVEKSTDIFLALNNAILAGGASTEIQASALEQMSQAYAKGKPDMMEWRSLMTAMPAQLKQVADAMGYASADELGESLRNGTVSMDEFMGTITKLNTEGLNGFQSFEEQAKNSTGGIATSITVAKTQIVKGVADIIDGLNKGLQEANLPSVSEIIANVGKKAKEVLDKVASKLPSIIKTLKTLTPIITGIVIVLGSMYASFKLLTIISTITNTIKAFQLGIVALKTTAILAGGSLSTLRASLMMLNLTFLASPIFWIIAGIVALIATFVLLWNKCEWFRNFWIGLWEGLKKIFEDWVNGFKLMVEILKSVFSLVINWFNIKIQYWINIFRGVINFITGIFTGNWRQAFNGLKQVVSAFINSLLNSFGGLPRRMLSVGLDIVKGIGRGITSGINWIKNVISSFVGNVTRFIKRMFKIGSPSKLMKDEVGQWLPKGIAVGIEANTDSVENAMNDMYKEMNRTIKMENSKMNFDVVSGNIYNKSFYQTPVSIDLNANVEMDSQRVGRLVTPSVTKTIKNGGGI